MNHEPWTLTNRKRNTLACKVLDAVGAVIFFFALGVTLATWFRLLFL